MSAFAIFVLVLTFLYVVYYAAVIMQDVYGKKDTPKTDEEEFDVSNMQDVEEPISISEDPEGFRFSDSPDESYPDPSPVTLIDSDDDVREYQEKLHEEQTHRSAKEECARMQESLDPIDSDSTGATTPDVMLEQLLNQKPGGPKIFITRENI